MCEVGFVVFFAELLLAVLLCEVEDAAVAVVSEGIVPIGFLVHVITPGIAGAERPA